MKEEIQVGNDHEGETWRKDEPFDWCRINRNETIESSNYDGGAQGFAVSYGKYFFKRKRVYWHSTGYFVLAHNYDAFVTQMKREQRHLMCGVMKEQKNEL